MRRLRIGFMTGSDRWLQKEKLVAKYLKMRLEGVVYPDVYALPYMIGDGCDFLCNGESIPEGKYDLLLSELNASESQLQYLQSVVLARVAPAAVIPGPPEILSRELTHRKLLLVREILSEAAYVWAYSETIREFCDGLIGQRKAEVIPWPFDAAATVRIAAGGERDRNRYRVLLNAPFRFFHNTQNFPFVLKGALLKVWDELPAKFRDRVTFHSFVYTHEDEEQFRDSGFAEGLPIHLEPKKQYRSFVRFLGGCNAVINLQYGNVLGRVTFIAAALGKPGIFTDGCEVNRALYPDATVPLLHPERLYTLLRGLLLGMAAGDISERFLPSTAAACHIGNFAANACQLRTMLQDPAASLIGGRGLQNECP